MVPFHMKNQLMHIFIINTNLLAPCHSGMFTDARQAREAHRCINIKDKKYIEQMHKFCLTKLQDILLNLNLLILELRKR